MPNHVEHDLIITGKTEDIKAMISEMGNLEEGTLDNNKIFPMPEAYRTQEGYSNYGYDYPLS